MEPGETPHPHRGAPCAYSHVETFKTLSSVTFVQSRALSGDAGGAGGRVGGAAQRVCLPMNQRCAPFAQILLLCQVCGEHPLHPRGMKN